MLSISCYCLPLLPVRPWFSAMSTTPPSSGSSSSSTAPPPPPPTPSIRQLPLASRVSGWIPTGPCSLCGFARPCKQTASEVTSTAWITAHPAVKETSKVRPAEQEFIGRWDFEDLVAQYFLSQQLRDLTAMCMGPYLTAKAGKGRVHNEFTMKSICTQNDLESLFHDM